MIDPKFVVDQCDAEFAAGRASRDAEVAALRAEVAASKEALRSSLRNVAQKLRRAGADLPAPENKGTPESAILTGLSIALLLVESEINTALGGEGK